MKTVFISLGFLLLVAAQSEASFKTPLSEFVAKLDCEVALNPNIPAGFGIKDNPNHAIIEIPEKEKLSQTWGELTAKLAAKFQNTPTLKNYMLFMDPNFSKIPMIQKILRYIARNDTKDLLADTENSDLLVKQILSTAAQMEQSVLRMLPQEEIENTDLVTAVALRFDQLQERNSSEGHFDLLNGYVAEESPYLNSFLTFGAGTEMAPDWNGYGNVGEWIQTPKGSQTVITGGGRTFYQAANHKGIAMRYFIGDDGNVVEIAKSVLELPKGMRPTFHSAPHDKDSGYPPRVLLFVSMFASKRLLASSLATK